MYKDVFFKFFNTREFSFHPKKECEEICICLVLAELLHFKLKSRISSTIYAKKLT